MSIDLSCKKVSSLLSQYIDNKVSDNEREFIEEHLSMCPDCYKKFIYLKNLINSLKDSYKKVMDMAIKKNKNATFSIREHEEFMENLSPYVDNELENAQNYEFRTYLIKSKMAQKELKRIYSIQKKLHSSYEEIKKTLNIDFSKKIIEDIKSESLYWQTQKYVKVAIMAILLIFSAVEIKQFYVPIKNKLQKTIFKKKDVQYVKVSEPLASQEILTKDAAED